MKSRNVSGGLVYSTEHGRMCPQCGFAVAQCQCGKQEAPAGDGVVRVRRETKGRNGKAVTVIQGAPLNALELAQLGKQLKNACGSGGTVKDGVIEIQGDHCEQVVGLLKQRGWTVKRAGG
ncbi:translation initiation factor Sui1 [Chromobacterium haemolyticum]|uniref:translation initiation factor Sui1 n=1 Tax=Chromobacterium haemolyticum TaxID=394935 RepID=UPI0040554C3F